jgi:hypothetical protein
VAIGLWLNNPKISIAVIEILNHTFLLIFSPISLIIEDDHREQPEHGLVFAAKMEAGAFYSLNLLILL